MADELQALLNRIADDEYKKADAKREEILQQARTEADAIKKQAEEEAAAILTNARKEELTLLQKGKESLQQAARDVLLSLRSQMESRLKSATEALLQEKMQGDALAKIISQAIGEFIRTNGDQDDVQVLLPPDQLKVLEQSLKAQLAADLQKKSTFAPANLTGGFKLIFQKSGVVYDFTDEALTEALTSYLGPKIAELLK